MNEITLLDGSVHDRQDLIEKMKDDSFYYDKMKNLTLNNSGIKLILKSPKTFDYVMRYGSEESQALRDGKLFHWAILEPEKFQEQHFVDVQSKNTKAYKLAKEEFGSVFTMKEKSDAERLADAFFRNEKAMSYITNCEFEVPLIGNIMGYPFRGKADIIKRDMIFDIKTTSDISAFEVSAKKYGYDVQAFVYCELFGVSYENFIFVVIDKGSLDIGIYDVSEEAYERGRLKVQQALNTYHNFFEMGEDLHNYYLTGTI